MVPGGVSVGSPVFVEGALSREGMPVAGWRLFPVDEVYEGRLRGAREPCW